MMEPLDVRGAPAPKAKGSVFSDAFDRARSAARTGVNWAADKAGFTPKEVPVGEAPVGAKPGASAAYNAGKAVANSAGYHFGQNVADAYRASPVKPSNPILAGLAVAPEALLNERKNAFLDDPDVPWTDKARVTAKDVVRYGTGAAGGVLGVPIGQAAIPVPFVGAAAGGIGGMALGDKLGGWVGDTIFGDPMKNYKGKGWSLKDDKTPPPPNEAEVAAKAAAEEKAAAAELAASPLRDPVLNRKATETSADVRRLRDAGVEGPLQGNVTVMDPETGVAKTGRNGIRTIQTMSGNVYAGRDKNGQLNVSAGADLSPEQHAALQAAEAARTRADLQRQVNYFANERLKSDLASNNPDDRRRGLLGLAHQQQIADLRNKELDREVARRGQDIALRGHELEYGAKAAQLRNQMMQQTLERNSKTLDSILGGETIKVDGKDVPNTRRQQILSDMNMTLGQHGMHLGHMTPKDLQEFFTANEIGDRTEPAAITKAFQKWVLNRPYVRDFDPHRRAARAQGLEGQSNNIGYYTTPNGSYAWEPSAVGRQFFTGEYSGPAMRYLNQ